jgi:CheY-specific phosphatase CheX
MSLVFERSRLEQQLTGAATEVLETMFFTVVDSETTAQTCDGLPKVLPRIGAVLKFQGACSGHLALSLESEAARDLATSFFGTIGEHGAEEDRRSVVAELTNMVCGAMLSHLDRHSIFCLASPVALAEGMEAEGEIVRLLRLEYGLLRLAFSVAAPDLLSGKVEAI